MACEALPAAAVSADRTIDLRNVPAATAEAFVLEVFRQLFHKQDVARSVVTTTVAFLVPPFRRSFVNMPSTQEPRNEVTWALREQREMPKPVGGLSLDDDLTDLSREHASLPSEMVRLPRPPVASSLATTGSGRLSGEPLCVRSHVATGRLACRRRSESWKRSGS